MMIMTTMTKVLKWTSLLCGAMNGWSSIMIEATLTLLSLRFFHQCDVIIKINIILIIKISIIVIFLIIDRWFPPGERTTATGVVIATQMAGLLPPALLFPRIVQVCKSTTRILSKLKSHFDQEPEVDLDRNCSSRDPDLMSTMKNQVFSTRVICHLCTSRFPTYYTD